MLAKHILEVSDIWRHFKFSLFENDPLYKLLSKFGLATNERLRLMPCVAVFWILTWLVVALLAQMQGVAFGPTPQTSFLIDFAAYAQFFVGIPLFLIAEGYIDNEIAYGFDYMFAAGILRDSNIPSLEEKKELVSKFLNSWLSLLCCWILAWLVMWVYVGVELTNGSENWHALVVGHSEHITWAGSWHAVVSAPILFMLIFRWIWKVGIWYWFLLQISQMELHLKIGHPDRCAGLGFLARVQSRFAILIFASGFVVAVTTVYKLAIENAPYTTIIVWGPIIVYVLFAPLFFFAPLLFFRKALFRAKLRGIFISSSLLSECLVKLDEDLGSPEGVSKLYNDFPSLSELSALYASARETFWLPFDFASFLRIFIASLSSMVPLITHLPSVNAIINLVIGFVQ